jgi:hypothetical protein
MLNAEELDDAKEFYY